MSKFYQRLILIVAILLSGLTYVLQTWKNQETLEAAPRLDSVSRAMRFSIPPEVVDRLVDPGAEFVLLSVLPQNRRSLLHDMHTVMGGLGAVASKVRAVHIAPDVEARGDGWQIGAHSEYPKIAQVALPKDQQSLVLKNLRICWQQSGYCRGSDGRGSDFLYLIDLRNDRVLYYGDFRWGVLALVQDVQLAVGEWS